MCCRRWRKGRRFDDDDDDDWSWRRALEECGKEEGEVIGSRVQLDRLSFNPLPFKTLRHQG